MESPVIAICSLDCCISTTQHRTARKPRKAVRPRTATATAVTPVSCTTRMPCRSVMRAAGQRATAARWGLLFSALFATVLAQPTDEPSDHESGQQERDDHAHADKHIGENDSSGVHNAPGARRRSASMPLYGQSRGPPRRLMRYGIFRTIE
jgi:hypothetical protein